MERLSRYQWVLVPVIFFCVWRGGVELVARVAAQASPQLAYAPYADGVAPPPLAHYDSEWYASIVNVGYASTGAYANNAAFFPLYPLVWKFVQLGTGLPTYAAGLVISAVLSLLLCIVFYRWVSRYYSQTTARLGLLALLAWPSSVFLASAYSEPLFLLLVAVTFFAAAERKWTLAAVAALAAGSTRFLGIVLWPVLMYLYWREADRSILSRRGELYNLLAVILLPPLGLAAFMVYLWYAGLGPLAWLVAEFHWWRTPTNPLGTLWWYAQDILSLEPWWRVRALEFGALVFAAAFIPRLWRLERAYAFYVAGSLVIPLVSGHLASQPRFTLGLLPLFIVLGQVRGRYLYFMYLLVSLPLLVVSIQALVTWHWAG